MARGRLLVLPFLAAIIALVFLLFLLASRHPIWMFGTSMSVGLVIGAVRGLTMKVQYDQMWQLVRPTGRRVLLWVALALAASVVLEIVGALATPPNATLRFVAAEAATVCAGLMIGHALGIVFRLWRLPHSDLRGR